MLSTESINSIQERINKTFACDCLNKELRYKLNQSNAKMYYLQCTRCGIATRIRKDKVPDPDSNLIKPVDEALQQSWWKNKDNYRQALYDQYRNNERQAWFDWYNQYLKTDKWRKKRAAVLERAKGLCEGCRSKEATQVHHLTYDRVGNEMLFDLVAVCDECHEVIHDSKTT